MCISLPPPLHSIRFLSLAIPAWRLRLRVPSSLDFYWKAPLGPLGCECARHRPTPRPSLERICRPRNTPLDPRRGCKWDYKYYIQVTSGARGSERDADSQHWTFTVKQKVISSSQTNKRACCLLIFVVKRSNRFFSPISVVEKHDEISSMLSIPFHTFYARSPWEKVFFLAAFHFMKRHLENPAGVISKTQRFVL